MTAVSLFRHYYPGMDVATVSIKMFWLMLTRLQDVDERVSPVSQTAREWVDRMAKRRREE